jgi:TetR/AcrR family transcriptional regulator, acrAB operon repressor
MERSPNRKAEQSSRTKRAVLDAAIALFGENGYRATPLKAIGLKAGISHGVIPFHFGSKEGLLHAVVEECFALFHAALLEPLGDMERDFGTRDLEAIMSAQRRFSAEHPEVGRLFVVLMFEALGPSPELRPHFAQFHERIRQLGSAWLREGQRRGSVRDDLDVDAAIEALFAFFNGLRAHALLLGDGLDIARVHGQMLAFLRHGAAPQADRGKQ